MVLGLTHRDAQCHPHDQSNNCDQWRHLQRPSQAFTDLEWIYEIKFDGYRTVAGFGKGQEVQLRTKRGASCTRWYPEVAEVLASVPGGPHVIDGEATVLDDIGRSDFNPLHQRALRRCWYKDFDQVTLCAFDILVHDGREVMDLPLLQNAAPGFKLTRRLR